MPDYETISIHPKGEVTVIQVSLRRIYLKVVEDFREDLQKVLASTSGGILIDMENVSVMNSAGLGVLISLQDQMQKQQRRLVLCNLQPLMQEIFTRMKLETLITLARDQEEGLKVLNEDEK